MTRELLVQIVEQARQGDTRAFDLLVRQYQATAVAYARTLLHDPAAAEDAAQESFVQAWRDLPSLTEAAAFGSWLRRIVFKFCDRARRSARPTLPLDVALPIAHFQEPAFLVGQAEEAGRIRGAVDALPPPLREVTFLYYLTGRDVQEVADFLDVPVSTVKNRLHAARKQLRKELWTMAETILENEAMPQDAAFARNVLARVLKEFQQQEAVDPHQADRKLLDEGRSALLQTLQEGGALDTQTVRDGFTLFWRRWEWPPLTSLLVRYLAEPLSDSEMAWASLHLANALAMSGSPAGAVLAHEAFERRMPGKSPRLSARWPYFPASVEDVGAFYDADEVGLLFLSQSGEFATSYLGVWRGEDYLSKVDALLEQVPVTTQNRLLHFYALRMACCACESADDLAGAGRYVRQMFLLSEGTEEADQKAELLAKALGHEIDLAHRRREPAAWLALVERKTRLLSAERSAEARVPQWVRGERHDLACDLVTEGRYDLALPLWEANAASGGQVGGWGWLLYAATVWRLTRDRPRTLALLRDARAYDDRDMVPLFAGRAEFADVRDDTEFLQALGKKFAIR